MREKAPPRATWRKVVPSPSYRAPSQCRGQFGHDICSLRRNRITIIYFAYFLILYLADHRLTAKTPRKAKAARAKLTTR